jgi:ribosomal protein L29
MAIIKKNEIAKMSIEEANKRIGELEKAALENEGEGRKEKCKTIRKTIAKLKTHITKESVRKKA